MGSVKPIGMVSAVNIPGRVTGGDDRRHSRRQKGTRLCWTMLECLFCIVALENWASKAPSSASSAYSINWRPPDRIKSGSGPEENPFGSGKAVMVSPLVRHILFSSEY